MFQKRKIKLCPYNIIMMILWYHPTLCSKMSLMESSDVSGKQ